MTTPCSLVRPRPSRRSFALLTLVVVASPLFVACKAEAHIGTPRAVEPTMIPAVTTRAGATSWGPDQGTTVEYRDPDGQFSIEINSLWPRVDIDAIDSVEVSVAQRRATAWFVADRLDGFRANVEVLPVAGAGVSLETILDAVEHNSPEIVFDTKQFVTRDDGSRVLVLEYGVVPAEDVSLDLYVARIYSAGSSGAVVATLVARRQTYEPLRAEVGNLLMTITAR
jgi:hypothetical protein